MKKKFLTSLIVISMSMSMGVPVFAADQTVQGTSPQSGTVPVIGNIEKYTPPTPGTEINVSIPTSMAFDIGYNKDTEKTNLKSADYTITNNGDTAVDVTSQYDVTDKGGVTLTTPDKVNSKDSDLELALSLNAAQAENPTTAWIQNVTDKSTGNTINVASKATEHMQFSATDADLANITQHAKDGKLTSETDVKGNLVLTFNAQKQTPPQTENWKQVNSFDYVFKGSTINETFKNNTISLNPIASQNTVISYSVNNVPNTVLTINGYPVKIDVKSGDIVTINVDKAPIKGAKVIKGSITLKVTDKGLEMLMNN